LSSIYSVGLYCSNFYCQVLETKGSEKKKKKLSLAVKDVKMFSLFQN